MNEYYEMIYNSYNKNITKSYLKKVKETMDYYMDFIFYNLDKNSTLNTREKILNYVSEITPFNIEYDIPNDIYTILYNNNITVKLNTRFILGYLREIKLNKLYKENNLE